MKDKKNPNYVLKYAGMAAQMAAAIFVGVWLGKQVDSYFEFSKPYFMVLGSLVMLAGVFYLIFRDLNQSN